MKCLLITRYTKAAASLSSAELSPTRMNSLSLTAFNSQQLMRAMLAQSKPVVSNATMNISFYGVVTTEPSINIK